MYIKLFYSALFFTLVSASTNEQEQHERGRLLSKGLPNLKLVHAHSRGVPKKAKSVPSDSVIKAHTLPLHRPAKDVVEPVLFTLLQSDAPSDASSWLQSDSPSLVPAFFDAYPSKNLESDAPSSVPSVAPPLTLSRVHLLRGVH